MKQINKNRGSKSEDNIVMKVLNEAPEEYRTEISLPDNELKNLNEVDKTQSYLKEVRDLYNQGYSKEYAAASTSKGKDVAFMGKEQVLHYKKQFKCFCRNCGKQGQKSFECRSSSKPKTGGTGPKKNMSKAKCVKYQKMRH